MTLNKVITGIIIFLIVIVLYSCFELHFPIDPYIDTIFTKNFTWDKFNKINTGMTKEEVSTILDEPFRKLNAGKPDECWQYSTDGKLHPYADFSWYAVNVCYTNNLVSSKPIHEFGN